MSTKVILVLLDACRGDYINSDDTPFLARLSEEGRYYKYLVPSFGFCERTEILVGTDALDSECFTAFGYNPKLSPYRSFHYFFKLLGFVEEKINSAFFSKVIRRLIWEILRSKSGTFYPARIPLGQLADFCLTEDGALNLIDNSDLSLYKVTHSVYMKATTSLNQYLSGTDQSRLDDVVKALDGPDSFYPTYVAELDAVGHVHGPGSSELKSSLKHVDSQLEMFQADIHAAGHNPVIVLCGDHGMSPVTSKVDIKSVFDRLKKEKYIGKGSTMFLDSTMARFWFDGQESNQVDLLREAIQDQCGEQGYFVDKNDFSDFGIPDLKMYGDLIWLCNEGVVISPDYFSPSNKVILGMHGYRPMDKQHYGFCIVNGGGVERGLFESPAPLTAVYNELHKHLVNPKK